MTHTIIIGAGMAGLSAAITLGAKAKPGERITLIEKQPAPGGKMRTVSIGNHAIDAGPTVFTMHWVFTSLFAEAGLRFEDYVQVQQARTLARHFWDGDTHPFDLHADEKKTVAQIKDYFGAQNAEGYRRFSADSKAIFETLKDTFIAAPRPSPVELTRRIGFLKLPTLLALRPFSTLWDALGDYFTDPRLRQLFGRYATYVGSSPFAAPATLMLIAHVEQAGVWTVDGGMHALAKGMEKAAHDLGVSIRRGHVQSVVTRNGRASQLVLSEGETIAADRIVYAGDVSHLTPAFFDGAAPKFPIVPFKDRALSAITFNVSAPTSGQALHRHNVFFSNDYPAEFDAIFKQHTAPHQPTVYVCAQSRGDDCTAKGDTDQLLCLINAPAFGDAKRLSKEELAPWEEATFSLLARCGLTVERTAQNTHITQPADFEALFPGSGGALYGRASHGWLASFSRPGARTKLKNFYLAGGSVHPGAGVPMATLSGQLAAQQMMQDHGSI
ncbi:MAG: 1-hydroxycarotenoid 3,4-desaturase CrtD [Pseudomonadota bacterium]